MQQIKANFEFLYNGEMLNIWGPFSCILAYYFFIVSEELKILDWEFKKSFTFQFYLWE